MRPSFLLALAGRVALGLLLLLAGGAAPCREGVLPASPPGPGSCAGKPSPPAGILLVTVADRPAPDRVVLETTWQRGRHGGAESVELVLPVGAVLLEGPRRAAFDPEVRSGRLRWTVAFPTGSDLDAVVRLRSGPPAAPFGREKCVRLAHAR